VDNVITVNGMHLFRFVCVFLCAFVTCSSRE